MSEQYVKVEDFILLKDRVIVVETNQSNMKTDVSDIKLDMKDIKSGQTKLLYWIMGTLASVLCCFIAIVFAVWK